MIVLLIGDSVREEILNIIDRLKIDYDFLDYASTLRLERTIMNPFVEGFSFVDLDDEEKLRIALVELETLKVFYEKRHISDDILMATLSDLKFRIERYYELNGSFGLSAHDMKWLGYIYRYETFQLHNLKFRKYPLTFEEIERSGRDFLLLSDAVKKTYYDGLHVVYVHISAHADLSEESVTESFALAESFFSNHFSEYEFDYYICRTWMLYPGLIDLMGEDSNIIKFQKRFEIIGTHDVADQTLSRVYNTINTKEIQAMPKTTSLMKTAYLNMDKLGVGVGVINRRNL